MKFIFDCDDAVCLPAAYHLVENVKEFLEKMKTIEISDEEAVGGRKTVLKKIIENMMVNYPSETGALLSRLWILEDGEVAPNAFKTMAVLFKNEVAIDFFTSVMPSLLQLSKEVSPLLKSKK